MTDRSPTPISVDKPNSQMPAGEDHAKVFSFAGLAAERELNLGDQPDEGNLAASDKSALSIEAEVENALSALRGIRAGKNTLQQALHDEQEQNRELRRLVEELTTYKDQARRELTAAAKMLTAEQERTTFLERNVRSAELRARSMEEWNVKLRRHLDVLVESILEESSSEIESNLRRASA